MPHVCHSKHEAQRQIVDIGYTRVIYSRGLSVRLCVASICGVGKCMADGAAH